MPKTFSFALETKKSEKLSKLQKNFANTHLWTHLLAGVHNSVNEREWEKFQVEVKETFM